HPDGRSKYYNNQTYPIDIHAPAQLVVALSKMDVFTDYSELIDKVLKWTIKNMQDKEGYFYYQKKKGISSKIPYMRWAQSWMFYALTHYINEKRINATN
ncbi:MAG: delta-aminolevulinic acid dehydratase, partial [Flavobacteriaceae bacterium]